MACFSEPWELNETFIVFTLHIPFAIAATFMLLCGSLQASSPPAEFLNIPWKAAPAEAKRIMAQHEGVTVKEESSERIVFQGGTFGSRPVDRWELEFPGGQFRRGTVYVVIPPGVAKDGASLRNHQFGDYYKSLSEKYGKVPWSGDSNHTQAMWTWTTSDRWSGQKDTVSILLAVFFNPSDFKIQYSSEPQNPAVKPAFGKPVKTGDL